MSSRADHQLLREDMYRRALPRRRLPPWTVVVLLVSASIVAVTWLAPAAALDGAEEALRWLRARNHDTGRAVLTTVVVATTLLLYVAAWGRATAHGRDLRLRVPGGELESDREHTARVTMDDLAALLEDALSDRHDVERAEVRVRNLHRRGLAVEATLDLAAHARLHETAQGARALVGRVLAEQAGARLAGEPRLHLRYRELRLRRSA